MTALDRIYHVPRSQVWEGSRGRQHGNIHLHVRERFDLGRIHRAPGRALCGKNGWYERPADEHDRGDCPRCAQIAARIPTVLSSGALPVKRLSEETPR